MGVENRAAPTPQRSRHGGPRAPRRRGRRRRVIRRFAARAVLALVCLALIALVVCGCLYIREHLFRSEDSGDGSPPSPAGDTRSDGPPPPAGPADPADSPYSGAVVVLDAGHGGVQPGCEYYGTLEKDVTLPVTLLAAEKLKALGVTVVLTRDADTDVSLDGRCEIANGAHADLFVSIHCNAYPSDPAVSGLEGYYHDSAAGQRLAASILDAAGALSIPTRGVKDAGYQVLRETAMPAALIEIGYLSNAGECAALRSPDYQETVAQAVAEGVIRALKT